MEIFRLIKCTFFYILGIIYKNGDYQTVNRKTLNVCDKFNKIEKNAYKPYTYNLFPNERQKENIDHLIKESQVEEKKAGIVYSYEPDKPIGSIIKYREQKAYVDIMDVGEVEADMFDYPVGNCHEIHVKKVSGVYRITFYCYKRVVGIDLGERVVICSTGERFELPQIELKKQSKYWEIKQQWKESVAMQLLLDYDILFLEYLENDGNTRQGFEDMITFSDVLVEKAEIFNKGNPKEPYKKEIYKLKSKYPSTQICHMCGYQNEDMAANLQKRNWMCPYCGTKHDRDINAAINILRHGMEEKILNNKIEENELSSIDLSKVHFDVTLD